MTDYFFKASAAKVAPPTAGLSAGSPTSDLPGIASHAGAGGTHTLTIQRDDTQQYPRFPFPHEECKFNDAATSQSTWTITVESGAGFAPVFSTAVHLDLDAADWDEVEPITTLDQTVSVTSTSDNGSGKLRCAAAGHGLVSGQTLSLDMVDNAHDGQTGISVINVNVFDCDDIDYNSTADTGTGTIIGWKPGTGFNCWRLDIVAYNARAAAADQFGPPYDVRGAFLLKATDATDADPFADYWGDGSTIKDGVRANRPGESVVWDVDSPDEWDWGRYGDAHRKMTADYQYATNLNNPNVLSTAFVVYSVGNPASYYQEIRAVVGGAAPFWFKRSNLTVSGHLLANDCFARIRLTNNAAELATVDISGGAGVTFPTDGQTAYIAQNLMTRVCYGDWFSCTVDGGEIGGEYQDVAGEFGRTVLTLFGKVTFNHHHLFGQWIGGGPQPIANGIIYYTGLSRAAYESGDINGWNIAALNCPASVSGFDNGAAAYREVHWVGTINNWNINLDNCCYILDENNSASVAESNQWNVWNVVARNVPKVMQNGNNTTEQNLAISNLYMEIPDGWVNMPRSSQPQHQPVFFTPAGQNQTASANIVIRDACFKALGAGQIFAGGLDVNDTAAVTFERVIIEGFDTVATDENGTPVSTPAGVTVGTVDTVDAYDRPTGNYASGGNRPTDHRGLRMDYNDRPQQNGAERNAFEYLAAGNSTVNQV